MKEAREVVAVYFEHEQIRRFFLFRRGMLVEKLIVETEMEN